MKKITFLFLLICSISFGQVPSYVPTDSLVGWWPFNGNANDESGNGYTGTVNGASLTSDRFGNTNSAYSFQETNSEFISIPNPASLAFGTSAFSLMGWFKIPDNQTTNEYGEIIRWDNCVTGNLWGIRIWNGEAEFLIGQHLNVVVLTTNVGPFLDSSWHQIISTYDDFGEAKLYVDGVLLESASGVNYNLTHNSNQETAIGRCGSFNGEYFNGKLDDVGIWNRALDSCEIINLYNASWGCGCSPTTATDTQSACNTYTWIDGNTYTASNNTATIILTNSAGCDSVITLDLTINSATVDAGNDQIVCLGCADIPDDSIALSASGAQSYAWDNGVSDGVYFTPSTTALYTVTGTDANGCTGTDTVTVFVGARSCVAISISGLDSASYANQTYYQSGLDTIYHTNASGCDSIEYLDITINHTGINENILKEVEVYPNPTSDIITLKGINSLTDVSYIHLLDNKGALLRKIGINETQVDLSSLSTGIYFIEIQHQLGSGRIKVIKQ